MRTQEQIIADCEKRYEELQAEADRRAADPKIQRPCETCRWHSSRGDGGYHWGSRYPEYHTCIEPLVKGYKKWGLETKKGRRIPPLCGPEKALWQPKPTIAERILTLLEKWFGDAA